MDQPVRRRRRRRSTNRIWILLAAVTMLCAVGVVALGILLPYALAESAMPEDGEMAIYQQEDGTLVLSWPEADQADHYCVEFLRPAASEEQEAEVVYREFVTGAASLTLPQLPETVELTLRIRSVMEYRTLTERGLRYSENELSATTKFRVPMVTELRWMADPDANTLDIKFNLPEGESSTCYLLDENGAILESRPLEGTSLHLTFGDEGDYPIPGFEDAYYFAFDACRKIPGLAFYGYRSGRMTVVRDHLLGRELTVKCINRGENVCTLTWNETKGNHYEVQAWDEDGRQWVTVCTVAADGERSYTTGHQPAFRRMTYRVLAVGGQVMEGSEYAAISDEVVYTTGASTIFATIWPMKNLNAYALPGQEDVVGEAKKGKAYCVLEEKNGMFAVMVEGQKAYIDSNYCMINLPEYMGELCGYEITNSLSSFYMVHEFEIPRVTGVVTSGYEKVQLYDGSYLVPLLYPTAQKLLAAAQNAAEQGYRLKIYDSFRPYKATREIYDRTALILDEELPKKTYTGVSLSSLNLPAPEEVTMPDGETKTIRTYRMVMTGSGYGLGSFLAKSGSMHNLGIALDLTLEDLTTGLELQMQTSIHDLSKYSVTSRNNSSAKKLAKIMKDAGFGTITSEWWHFQDNESRDALKLTGVTEGISAEGWMADDRGWKYRKANGRYCCEETRTIDGVEYTFDAEGYCLPA